MLILTRRPGETLIIETPAGEQIKVTVLQVKGSQVRIGTQAPADISVVREDRRAYQQWLKDRKRPIPVFKSLLI